MYYVIYFIIIILYTNNILIILSNLNNMWRTKNVFCDLYAFLSRSFDCDDIWYRNRLDVGKKVGYILSRKNVNKRPECPTRRGSQTRILTFKN